MLGEGAAPIVEIYRMVRENGFDGWISVEEPWDFHDYEQSFKSNALAWETGTGPAALIHGLEQSLKLLTETGSERIQSHLEKITDHLCERLVNSPYRIVSSRLCGEKSQIVCIQHTHGLSPMHLYSHLKDRGIITAPRGDRLRISPHLYNTAEEIDALVNVLP